MLRPQLEEALKRAMKAREQCRVATIRLILAALKDRDMQSAARATANWMTTRFWLCCRR